MLPLTADSQVRGDGLEVIVKLSVVAWALRGRQWVMLPLYRGTFSLSVSAAVAFSIRAALPWGSFGWSAGSVASDHSMYVCWIRRRGCPRSMMCNPGWPVGAVALGHPQIVCWTCWHGCLRSVVCREFSYRPSEGQWSVDVCVLNGATTLLNFVLERQRPQ
jgi:hypothetical protein